MLEEVGEAGPARRLVLRADVVPEVDGDDRRQVVGRDDDAQAVGQRALAEADGRDVRVGAGHDGSGLLDVAGSRPIVAAIGRRGWRARDDTAERARPAAGVVPAGTTSWPLRRLVRLASSDGWAHHTPSAPHPTHRSPGGSIDVSPVRRRRLIALARRRRARRHRRDAGHRPPRRRRASGPSDRPCSTRSPTRSPSRPLISVGDTVGSYRFESLPDGIAIWPRGRSRVDLYVNHETSKVPFGGFADYRNSEVSHLVIKRGNGKVLSGDLDRAQQPRLPALLLQLHRRTGGRLRPAAPPDQRGGDRLRDAPGGLLAGPGRRDGRAGRHGRGRGPGVGRRPVDPGHGPPQPRERRRHPRLRPGGGRLGRRHLQRAELAVLHVPGRRTATRSGTTPAICTPSCPTDPTQNDYGDITAGESDLRHVHPGARRRRRRRPDRARELVQRQQRLPVHPRRGHRLRPRRTPTSSTSPTPASRGPSPRRPPGTRLARGAQRHARRLHERATLEDGPRPSRPDRRHAACSILPGADFDAGGYSNAERRPPARQHRVGHGRHPHPGGSRAPTTAATSPAAASPRRPTPASGGTTWPPARRRSSPRSTSRSSPRAPSRAPSSRAASSTPRGPSAPARSSSPSRPTA